MFKRIVSRWVLPAVALIFVANSAEATPLLVVSGIIRDSLAGSAFQWYNPYGSPNPKFGVLNYPVSTFTLTIDQDTGQVQSFTADLLSAFMFEGVNNGAGVWIPGGAAFDINGIKTSYTNAAAFDERDAGFDVTLRAGSKGSWFSQNVGAYGLPVYPNAGVPLVAKAAAGDFLRFTLINASLLDFDNLLGKNFNLNSWFNYNNGQGQIDIHTLGTITKVTGLVPGGGTPGGGTPGGGTSVPEPGSMLLLGIGIIGGMTRRKVLN